jgi:hypothetical protein
VKSYPSDLGGEVGLSSPPRGGGVDPFIHLEHLDPSVGEFHDHVNGIRSPVAVVVVADGGVAVPQVATVVSEEPQEGESSAV